MKNLLNVILYPFYLEALFQLQCKGTNKLPSDYLPFDILYAKRSCF